MTCPAARLVGISADGMAVGRRCCVSSLSFAPGVCLRVCVAFVLVGTDCLRHLGCVLPRVGLRCRGEGRRALIPVVCFFKKMFGRAMSGVVAMLWLP